MCSTSEPSTSVVNIPVENLVKRRKLCLPVVIVEDHNEVLYHWYRAIGAKKLPFENGTVLHFDSHPDLMIPANLDASRIHDRDYLLNSLSIENWIMPAVFAKHFTTIAWIKPPWATQINEGKHHFQIGCHQTTKEIKVTCPQSYFVSEMSWCSASELKNAHEVVLEVCTLDEKYGGDESSQTSLLSSELAERLRGSPFILDIDLDFYSTKNPFLSLFTEDQFQILRDLFHYEHPADNTDEALRQVTLKRRHQLAELRAALTPHLADTPSQISGSEDEEQPGEEEWTVAGAVRRPSLREKTRELLSTYNGDPGIVFDAGCTCDDCDLPHHVSTRDEIRNLISSTSHFLKSIPKPALVSISRSSRDDYCPPEDVEFVQDMVLAMLKSVFGELDVLEDFEQEDIISAVTSSS